MRPIFLTYRALCETRAENSKCKLGTRCGKQGYVGRSKRRVVFGLEVNCVAAASWGGLSWVGQRLSRRLCRLPKRKSATRCARALDDFIDGSPNRESGRMIRRRELIAWRRM